MRTYTVLLSVLVHAIAVAAVVVVPIVANDELPKPRRATTFVARHARGAASTAVDDPFATPGENVVAGIAVNDAREAPALTPRRRPPPRPRPCEWAAPYARRSASCR